MAFIGIEDQRKPWVNWEEFKNNPEAYMEVEFEALALFINDTQKSVDLWSTLPSEKKVQYYQLAAQRLYQVEFKRE